MIPAAVAKSVALVPPPLPPDTSRSFPAIWLPAVSCAARAARAISTTALDLITGALRNINALEAGETPNATDSADALQILNDLMESWSQDGLTLYGSNENILTLTPGKYQYTIGNYTGGTFTGTLLHGTPTISGVTVPSGLVVGGTITDIQGSIPANTTVLSFNSGAGTITLSANAAFDVAVAETFTYTIPGDFAITRPLRITNAFTRITASGNTGLDYQIEIINQDKYTAIGYKGVSGPWPTALCYVTTYPLGSLYFYPNPSTAGSLSTALYEMYVIRSHKRQAMYSTL